VSIENNFSASQLRLSKSPVKNPGSITNKKQYAIIMGFMVKSPVSTITAAPEMTAVFGLQLTNSMAAGHTAKKMET